MSRIRVAFIDDGINAKYILRKINFKQYEVHNGEVFEFNNFYSGITHGTICCNIFLDHLKDNKDSIDLFSIQILNDNKRCDVLDLVAALDWVDANKVNVVNLSLGTSYFGDEIILRDCIKRLIRKNIIIIAAQNNEGMITFPASFTGVLGGKSNDINKISYNENYITSGIEFLLPSKHFVKCLGRWVSNSNSFSLPVLTAYICNNYGVGKTVLDYKSTILDFNICSPIKFDWCNNAVIILSKEKFDISINEFFEFNVIKYYDYTEVKSSLKKINEIFVCKDADTLIIIYYAELECQLDEILEHTSCEFILFIALEGFEHISTRLKNLNLGNKCMLIGEKNYNKIFSFPQIGKFDIPLITVYYEKVDLGVLFKKIYEGKRIFFQNGYNCKIFSENPLGILCGFECKHHYDIQQYIDTHQVDIIIVLLELDHRENYINGDLNLIFNSAKEITPEFVVIGEQDTIYDCIINFFTE